MARMQINVPSLAWERVAQIAEQEGISRADVLRFQIAEASKALMLLERIPDPAAWLDGTVVTFTETFRTVYSGNRYSFAAIKANGRWYLTGTRSREALSDSSFRERLARMEISDIKVAASFVAVPPGTDTATHAEDLAAEQYDARDDMSPGSYGSI